MDFFSAPGSTLEGKDLQTFEEIRTVVDQATNEYLIRPDWDANMRCVDAVGAIRNGEVMAAVVQNFRRKLQSSDPRVLLLTLRLIEALVNNSGRPWYTGMNDRRFTDELSTTARRLVRKTGTEYQEVTEVCLDLIQAWGEGFLSQRKAFPNIVDMYFNLRKEGLPFKTQNQFDPSRIPIFAAPASMEPRLDPESDAILAAAIQSSLETEAGQDRQREMAILAAANAVQYDDAPPRQHHHHHRDRDRDRDRVAAPQRESSGRSSTSSTRGAPVASSHSAPSELETSLAESKALLLDLIFASSSNSELRENEVALELVEQMKLLVGRMVTAIEESIEDPAKVERLFKLNDSSQTLLAVYANVVNGSVRIADAKKTLRSEVITATSSSSAPAPATTSSSSSSSRPVQRIQPPPQHQQPNPIPPRHHHERVNSEVDYVAIVAAAEAEEARQRQLAMLPPHMRENTGEHHRSRSSSGDRSSQGRSGSPQTQYYPTQQQQQQQQPQQPPQTHHHHHHAPASQPVPPPPPAAATSPAQIRIAPPPSAGGQGRIQAPPPRIPPPPSARTQPTQEATRARSNSDNSTVIVQSADPFAPEALDALFQSKPVAPAIAGTTTSTSAPNTSASNTAASRAAGPAVIHAPDPFTSSALDLLFEDPEAVRVRPSSTGNSASRGTDSPHRVAKDERPKSSDRRDPFSPEALDALFAKYDAPPQQPQPYGYPQQYPPHAGHGQGYGHGHPAPQGYPPQQSYAPQGYPAGVPPPGQAYAPAPYPQAYYGQPPVQPRPTYAPVGGGYPGPGVAGSGAGYYGGQPASMPQQAVSSAGNGYLTQQQILQQQAYLSAQQGRSRQDSPAQRR